jgi:GDPmannose 4,6-dehydratase
MACNEIGLEVSFAGEGADEKGYLTGVDKQRFIEKVGEKYLEGIKARVSPSILQFDNSSVIVSVDPKYFRPTEVDLLIGDPTKARTKLGWEPQYDLDGLIKDMMLSDIKLMKKDAWLQDGGYRTMNYFE